MKEKIETFLEQVKGTILEMKEAITSNCPTRQKIMNFLGLYVDEESDEEVYFEDVVTEMFYGLLLKLYGIKEDEEEWEELYDER